MKLPNRTFPTLISIYMYYRVEAIGSLRNDEFTFWVRDVFAAVAVVVAETPFF